MAQTKIVLVDLDEEYLSALEKCFIKEFKHTAELSVITDEAYLKKHFSSPQTIDILLINEALYTQEFAKHNIAHLFILTENRPDPHGADPLLGSMVYKYTSVNELLGYVINRSGISGVTDIHTGVTKLVSVFSPMGGTGQTTVAAGLCAVLSRNFRRVLYVGLDGLQSFGFLLSGNQQLVGIDKTLVAKSPYAYDKVKPLIVSELFDILPPLVPSLASLGLSNEHMRHLIYKIKESGDYDFIVIDCPKDFTADTVQVMADSDQNVFVTLQDALSIGKLKSLFASIDYSDDSRFVLVCNRFNKKEENALAGLSAELGLMPEYIDEDPSMDPRQSEKLALVQGLQKLGQAFL